MTRPLSSITKDVLAPVWMRHDIPTSRIAETLGVSRQAVSLLAQRLGLPSRKGNQRPNQRVDDDTFRRMWLAGVSTTDMAQHFGYSDKSCISARRRLLGLPPRTRGTGQGHRGGWNETISLSEFAEIELARRMIEG